MACNRRMGTDLQGIVVVLIRSILGAVVCMILFSGNAFGQSVNFYGPPFQVYQPDMLNMAIDPIQSFPGPPETALQSWFALFESDNNVPVPGTPACAIGNAVLTPDLGPNDDDFMDIWLIGNCNFGAPWEDYHYIWMTGTSYPYAPSNNFGSGCHCDGGEGGGKNPLLMAGDPINIFTGNEYHEELDYSGDKWLTFRRFYNSAGVEPDTMGPHWRDSFSRSLRLTSDSTSYPPSGTEPPTVAQLLRPDGSQEVFTKTNGVWSPGSEVPDILLENDNAQGIATSYKVFIASKQQYENYNANGQLQSITDLTGETVTLTYSTTLTDPTIAPVPGLLLTVTDPTGRQLSFSYNDTGNVSQIVLPDSGTLEYTYDSSGNLASVQYPDNTIRHYIYDESAFTGGTDLPHALTGIVDESGNRYESTYFDDTGRAVSSSLAEGVDTTQITFNSDDSSTVEYPLGATIRRTYTTTPLGSIRVTSTSQPCNPECGQPLKTLSYDSNGYVASTSDFNGFTTAYTHDSAGLETQRIDAQGTSVQRTIKTTWDTVFRNPLERTALDASGSLTAKTDWVYNVRGQVAARCEDDPTVSGATSYACSTTTTPPAGVRRWVYTYCTAVGSGCPLVGLLLSVKGPRGDVTYYAYYTSTSLTACGAPGGVCHHLGDPWKVTDAVGHVTTTVSYDKDGRPTETKDPNGVITTFTYTPRGWLQTRTVAGATTTINYDAVGDVTKVTQPDGVYTSYGYDTAHRLTDIYEALGNHVHLTLDEAGNRTAENTYPSGSSTPSRSLSRVYNTLGQLVKSLDAYGNATIYGYDANGNRTDISDPLGVKTRESYDALNRLSQTVRNYLGTDSASANTTTTYDYDSHDNLSQVTDPDGLNTNYYYSGLNDLNNLLSPDTGTTKYTYDAAGNRITRTDARGVITRYTYDALNRLTSISYPVASLDVHYYYDQTNSKTGCTSSDPIGRLTEMVDPPGTTTYCYDAHGNVIFKRQVIGSSTYTTSYAWNAADRLMGIGYPDGASVTYARDAAGHIASVSASPVGGINAAIVNSVGYLPFGPATAYSFAGDGQALDKLYDANYRATDIEGSALNLHFKRDAMGDITAEGNAPGVSTPNETYQYDPLYRLLQVDASTGVAWQSYTYDKTGDRLSKALAGLGTDTYSYQSGTHRLLSISGYDVSNRAVDANGNTTAFQANGWTYGLGYNDTNRLTLVQQNGSTVATYGVNGLGERVAKTMAGGSTQAYIYDEGGRLLGEYATGQSRDYVWAGDTLIAILDNPAQGGDTIHYVYTDGLGTPRAITSQSGAMVWDWPYIQNPFGEAPASGNGYTLNLRYPGQYFDQEDGLNYNYFRDYEPSTGRYIESDRIGLAGGISTYAYALSNPEINQDRLGLATSGSYTLIGGGLYASPSGPGNGSGSTWCQNGILVPYIPPSPDPMNAKCGILDCERQHEESHIRDELAMNPHPCFGQSNGSFIGFYQKSDLWASERKAVAEEIRCLLERLSLLSQCDECRNKIQDRIKQEEAYGSQFSGQP